MARLTDAAPDAVLEVTGPYGSFFLKERVRAPHVMMADEAVLDEKGKVDAAKLNAFVFDQFRSGYYAIGEKVGQAWHTGAPLMKK